MTYWVVHAMVIEIERDIAAREWQRRARYDIPGSVRQGRGPVAFVGRALRLLTGQARVPRPVAATVLPSKRPVARVITRYLPEVPGRAPRRFRTCGRRSPRHCHGARIAIK